MVKTSSQLITIGFAMGITTTLICGDERETSVLATSFSGETSILFRFSLDASQPQSVNSRIVSCFHELEVRDAKCSFIDREEMRQAIYSCIAQVWQHCALHPSILLPDVVVQVHKSPAGKIVWQIMHESSYQEYLQGLMPKRLVQSSLISVSQLAQTAFVPIASLRFFNVLGGRGGTTLVHLDNGLDLRKRYAYKGLSYRLFLELGSGFENETQIFYHELTSLYSLPEHPNILSPPSFLVTTEDPASNMTSLETDQTYVCGSLYPYLEKQSMQEYIDASADSKERVPLVLKAKWAFQTVSALGATHAASQYHIDLKPSNMLLDNDENAILIDWEQCGASPFFLTPEADGSWDVRVALLQQHEESILQKCSKGPRLIYEKYTGPTRENNSGWPKWNVFPHWQIECPRALRAAEMYSLGRTLWVLFQQICQDELTAERIDFAPEPIFWDSSQVNIPVHRRQFVDQCVALDPNGRPDLDAAVSFWENEYQLLVSQT